MIHMELILNPTFKELLDNQSMYYLLFLESNSENCLDLIFVSSPSEKVIIVPDTNYITSAMITFIPSPGSFQIIGKKL